MSERISIPNLETLGQRDSIWPTILALALPRLLRLARAVRHFRSPVFSALTVTPMPVERHTDAVRISIVMTGAEARELFESLDAFDFGSKETAR